MKTAITAAILTCIALPAAANDETLAGQETGGGYAMFDLNYSSFNLSDDRSRYDTKDSVPVPNGQARLRYGDFIAEIQGTFTGNTANNPS
jgi:hypothetical protein